MIFGSDHFLVTSASNKLKEKMRQAKLSTSETEFFEQSQATDASVPQPAKWLLNSNGHLIDNNSPRLEKSPCSQISRHADVSVLTDDFILYTDALIAMLIIKGQSSLPSPKINLDKKWHMKYKNNYVS
jgi:hypothetical protein